MADQTKKAQKPLADILFQTWGNILAMCVEARDQKMVSEHIAIKDVRLGSGAPIAVTFDYWVSETERAQHTFVRDLNGDLAYCEGVDFRNAAVQIGRGQELLIILNRIQYILAFALGKPETKVQRYLGYLEKSMARLAELQQVAVPA